jgi:hypothetical protein
LASRPAVPDLHHAREDEDPAPILAIGERATVETRRDERDDLDQSERADGEVRMGE